MANCRACGKFTKKTRIHCGRACYGVAQRGRSRADRTSPSVKQYVQVRVDGKRIYLHRKVYLDINGEIPEGCIVHHKNENKRDNSPHNLGAVAVEKHLPHDHLTWRQKAKSKDTSYDPAWGF